MPRQNAVWSCQFWGWLWHSYIFYEKRCEHTTKLGRNRTLGGQFASSQQVVNVEVSLVQGLVINSCSLCVGCGSEQRGPATCSGACKCSARCWIKYDTPAALSMTVGTETVEPVRGKKVLKKHLQRSIGKLVAICSEHLLPVSLSSWCLMDYRPL